MARPITRFESALGSSMGNLQGFPMLYLEKANTTSTETGFQTAGLLAAFVHPWWFLVFFVVRETVPRPVCPRQLGRRWHEPSAQTANAIKAFCLELLQTHQPPAHDVGARAR